MWIKEHCSSLAHFIHEASLLNKSQDLYSEHNENEWGENEERFILLNPVV